MEISEKKELMEQVSPEKFCNEVCKKLKISAPEMVFDSSKTDLATYRTHEDVIIVNDKQPAFKQLYGIVHELRHKWQIENDVDYYFGTYKGNDEFEDDDLYNLQVAEIDANAYARLMIGVIFNVTVCGELPDAVNKKIEERTYGILMEMIDEVMEDEGPERASQEVEAG